MPASYLWNKPTRKLRRYRSLPRNERRYLLGVTPVLLTAWLGLHTLGLKRLLKVINKRGVSRTHSLPVNVEQAHRYAELTRMASKCCLPADSCLPQSLALCWLLQKKGFNPEVKIGVKTKTRAFSAHAWVVVDGVSLDDTTHQYQGHFATGKNSPTAKE